ncbi:amidase [Aliiglaciecola lipolytica]|uniref:Amidase n=1 Tax=Aliiglaciecola lipolytica E3 TaxID=1127673 RepID=K6X275_9ALTE|nr:amidase [Aliiglaciecola lipolytica]GAC14759.1 amidase [Aliiglaciecola lipolytica E3]
MNSSFNSPFVLPVNLNINNVSNTKAPQPLKGWTLAVKDLFHIDGIVTSAGNPDWADSHPLPTKTSETVSRLLDAGVQYVGKTITDELAYSLNGQNIHYPALVNCLDNERICGGSSSGSAVAVGRKLARIGLGTDTGGSIRIPASYNGLVGFRPSHGLISLKDVVPLAPSFDTAGWITNNIEDAVEIGKFLLPKSVEKHFMAAQPLVLNNLVESCEFKNELYTWLDSKFDKNWQSSLAVTSELLKDASDAFRVLQGREIWQTHGDWIKNTQPRFADDIQQRFQWCSTLSANDELAAIEQQQRLIKTVSLILNQQHYIVIPTTPGPAPRRDTSAREIAEYRKKLMQFTCIAGLTGCPQLHMPLFQQKNTAYGVSIIGPKNSDLELLFLGKQLMENIE